MLQQTLEEQGIIGAATLSGTFVPTDLKAAWCFIEEQGQETVQEAAAALGLGWRRL